MNKNVLIDTNVLIHDFWARVGNNLSGNHPLKDSKRAELALKKLSDMSFTLHVAAFAITQMVSVLQDKSKQQTPKKHKFPIPVVEKELRHILKKYNIVSFGRPDIELTTDYIKGIATVDIEDNLVYQLAKKMGCAAIITFNTKDYARYMDLPSVNPRFIQSLQGIMKR